MTALAPIGGKAQHLSVPDKFDPLIKPVSTNRDGEVLAGPRFERAVEHLHRLGPRAVGELLREVAHATGQPALIADRVQAYAALDPAVLRAVGADRFPPMPLGIVQ